MISSLAHRSESQVREKEEVGARDERGRKREVTVERGRKPAPSPAIREPPGGMPQATNEIRSPDQPGDPSQCARRNVGRWKGQPASLCPVLKTCPTIWLYNRRILDFCSNLHHSRNERNFPCCIQKTEKEIIIHHHWCDCGARVKTDRSHPEPVNHKKDEGTECQTASPQ